jgi:hypothetical protein
MPAMLALTPLGCASGTGKTGPAPANAGPFVQIFATHGVIQEIPDSHTAVIGRVDIPGVLSAGPLPLQVRNPQELKGLQPGDTISFQYNISGTNVWIGQLRKE